ncbi:WhiB family transcriptional regulator [Streptomyces sp. NPDC127066]|uniref:WhiB family transcriptional regulator n=1 Tax=Streptomyces sp. NPDC127066 TaxID=3347125 RepID=UPI00364B953D
MLVPLLVPWRTTESVQVPSRRRSTMREGHPRLRVRGDQTWQGRAACAAAVKVLKDPDLFFPGTLVDEQRVRLAKGICSSCEVRKMCLETALESGDAVGVRGGFTEAERRVMRNRFELRCDLVRVEAALVGRDVYLTRPERDELIRRAAESGTPVLRLAEVLKVSEAHVKKLIRRELRPGADGRSERPCIVQAVAEVAPI